MSAFKDPIFLLHSIHITLWSLLNMDFFSRSSMKFTSSSATPRWTMKFLEFMLDHLTLVMPHMHFLWSDFRIFEPHMENSICFVIFIFESFPKSSMKVIILVFKLCCKNFISALIIVGQGWVVVVVHWESYFCWSCLCSAGHGSVAHLMFRFPR